LKPSCNLSRPGGHWATEWDTVSSLIFYSVQFLPNAQAKSVGHFSAIKGVFSKQSLKVSAHFRQFVVKVFTTWNIIRPLRVKLGDEYG